MHSNSRFHSITRWPADSQRRWQLAKTDVDFCVALGRILFPEMGGVIPRELTLIWHTAKQVLTDNTVN